MVYGAQMTINGYQHVPIVCIFHEIIDMDLRSNFKLTPRHNRVVQSILIYSFLASMIFQVEIPLRNLRG